MFEVGPGLCLWMMIAYNATTYRTINDKEAVKYYCLQQEN